MSAAKISLRANLPTGGRTVITLKTEVVRLFNLMTIVKTTIANLNQMKSKISCFLGLKKVIES